MFDDAAVCYYCGHAFERTTTGSGRMPRWVMIHDLVVIGAFLALTLMNLW